MMKGEEKRGGIVAHAVVFCLSRDQTVSLVPPKRHRIYGLVANSVEMGE